MPVSGLLKLPAVCIIDNAHTQGMLHTLQRLHMLSCQGPVCLFSHYLGEYGQKKFEEQAVAFHLPLQWVPAGQTLVYDLFCGEDKYTPGELTVLLLPWLLKGEEVLVFGPDIPPNALEILAGDLPVQGFSMAQNTHVKTRDNPLCSFCARVNLNTLRRRITDIEKILQEKQNTYRKAPLLEVWNTKTS